MNQDKDIVDACILYRDALKENQAELLVPLSDLRVVYVPNMPHVHRTIWTQSDLILFYKTENPDEYGDFLRASDGPNGQRGVYFTAIINDDIDYHVTKMACDNLRQDYTRILRPIYIEIDSNFLLKVPKLLSFT